MNDQEQHAFTEIKQAWNRWAQVANHHGIDPKGGFDAVQTHLKGIKGEPRDVPVYVHLFQRSDHAGHYGIGPDCDCGPTVEERNDLIIVHHADWRVQSVQQPMRRGSDD